MSVARMTEQVGRVLGGRYRLEAPIGAGASSHVFLATDTRLKRQVAVKLLHEALVHDTQFLKRFQAEAQLAAALNHAHIMAVYDWGHDDVPYIVTEYLAGGSLRDLLDEGMRLTPSQALVVGLEATRALDYAHRRGVVHRDIKPANLLFDEERRLRIADFGIARALAEASVTEPEGTLIGTARYASPEQVRGEMLESRSDLYSLALVLNEAVTGRLPFDRDTPVGTLHARLAEPLVPDPELAALTGPLSRAGALDPRDRPDADELAVALMATAESLPRPEPIPAVGGPRDVTTAGASHPTTIGTVPGAATAPRLDRLSRRAERERERAARRAARGEVRRRRWPWVIATLIALAAVAAGAWFVYDSTRTPTHEVPLLVGADVADLDALVADFGWEIEIVNARQDGSRPDEIIDQVPAAGTQLEEGAVLQVTVSLGNTTVTIPAELVGLPVEEARLRLEAVGLALGTTTGRFDETIPAGMVIEVDSLVPEVPRGEAVALIVSDGPAPRAVPTDLVGLSIEEAQTVLAGLRLVAVEELAFDDVIPVGQVIAVPGAGTEVPADSQVTLVVSQGPAPVIIPDVEGLDVVEAADELEAVGLVAGETDGSASCDVLSTDPPAGEQVTRGSTVRIVTRDCEDDDD